jgi:hypothetical protein
MASELMRTIDGKGHNGHRRTGGLGAALAVACLALSGCAGSVQDRVGSLLVTPDKYSFYTYTCEQLADLLAAHSAREKQLEGLMAKAGPVISAATYDTEYLQVRAEKRELRQAAADRHCDRKTTGAPATGESARIVR